jgi:hypothetical protein
VQLTAFSGRGIAATIINFLEDHKVDYKKIKILGSDGTNTLTGYKVAYEMFNVLNIFPLY